MRRCDNCGKEYELKKNASKSQRFCSTYCRVAFHQKKKSQYTEELREFTCEICGKQYSPHRSTSKYCSAACKQAAYRKNKVKLFLIECFRCPIEECPNEIGVLYFYSKAYLNGAGFEKMVGMWKDNPEIVKNVDIRVYSRNERFDRQKEVFNNENFVVEENDYPFFVMSKGSSDMICIKFDKMFEPYWEGVVIEAMELQSEADKVGLSYSEYKDCLKQLENWKRKRIIKMKAKTTREANKIKKIKNER